MQQLPIKQLPMPQPTSGCWLSKSETGPQKPPKKHKLAFKSTGASTGLGSQHKVQARGTARQESRAPPKPLKQAPLQLTPPRIQDGARQGGLPMPPPRHSLHAKQSPSGAGQEKALKIQLQVTDSKADPASILGFCTENSSPTNAV